ncbi:WSSV066 [White spot syndrome virus]|uniref:WSSV066 n=1 Tax=White spot syndrome virus TaxID=342409 RepID=A0A2I6SBM1_9VIRU|nr:WSSV066 [White spot syndrome virus]
MKGQSLGTEKILRPESVRDRHGRGSLMMRKKQHHHIQL